MRRPHRISSNRSPFCQYAHVIAAAWLLLHTSMLLIGVLVLSASMGQVFLFELMRIMECSMTLNSRTRVVPCIRQKLGMVASKWERGRKGWGRNAVGDKHLMPVFFFQCRNSADRHFLLWIREWSVVVAVTQLSSTFQLRRKMDAKGNKELRKEEIEINDYGKKKTSAIKIVQLISFRILSAVLLCYMHPWCY